MFVDYHTLLEDFQCYPKRHKRFNIEYDRSTLKLGIGFDKVPK